MTGNTSNQIVGSSIAQCNGTPSKTGVWKYADKEDVKDECKDDFRRVDKACKPTSQEKRKHKQAHARKNKLRKKKGKAEIPYEKMTWKDAHCQGLNIKPTAESTKKNLEDIKTNIQEEIDGLEEKLENFVKDKVLSEAEKLAAKTGIRAAGAAVGGPLAPILEIGVAIWTIGDIVYSGYTLYEALDQIKDRLDKYQKLQKELPGKIAKLDEYLELRSKKGELVGADKKRFKQLGDEVNGDLRAMSDLMAEKADKDRCIKARKCMLIPSVLKHQNHKDKNKTPKDFDVNSSCCPGQTPHHLLPKTYFKNCAKYDAKEAPCVCVEGVSHYDGSHGEIHTIHDREAADNIEDGELSYAGAKDAALTAHGDTFDEYNTIPFCKRNCLEEQLDEYHQAVCGDDPQIYPSKSTSRALLDGAVRPSTPTSTLDGDDNSDG